MVLLNYGSGSVNSLKGIQIGCKGASIVSD